MSKKTIQTTANFIFFSLLTFFLLFTFVEFIKAGAKTEPCIMEITIREEIERKITKEDLKHPQIQEMINSEIISAKEQLKAQNIKIFN